MNKEKLMETSGNRCEHCNDKGCYHCCNLCNYDRGCGTTVNLVAIVRNCDRK